MTETRPMQPEVARAFSQAPAKPELRDNGGVRNIDDIKDRCRIDDITGCWNWALGCDGNGRPSVWLPALQTRTSMGVAICVLTTGERPPPGVVWHVTCRNMLCANPAHRKVGNRSTQMLAAKIKRTPVQRARMSASRRGGSKLTPEQHQEIAYSTMKLSEITERYGISRTYACVLRAGYIHRPPVTPGSSVFAVARRLR